jgi:alkylhydroperoxidase family enzyme
METPMKVDELKQPATHANTDSGKVTRKETSMKQGPWTRVRPLQFDEVDAYTKSAYRQGELTWGGFRSNLMRVMGHCPQLAITEVPYANAVIFDIDVYNNGKQYAGFLDRPLKELAISRTSLHNRSRYSITHHSLIGCLVFQGAGRLDEGHRKLLCLHEHEKRRDVYTDRENAVFDFAVNVAQDAHLVTDDQFSALKQKLREYNTGAAANMTAFDIDFIQKWKSYTSTQHDELVDSQLVELTWLIGQFCLLNRWFTVLQVPDETADDEDDFLAAYTTVVPTDIRERNEKILNGQF